MTSPELHARLLEVMPAILWSADATTFRFTYVSAGAESILGYPVDRWTDDPDFWFSHLHPDDSHIPALCHAETVAGRDHDLVYRMVAADGRVVWLRDSVKVHVEGGKPTAIYGVMTDVTREREAEIALLESRENFKRLVEQSPDCIGVHVDGVFVYVNDAFVRLVRAESPQQLLGRGAASFAQPIFHGVIRERHDRLRAGEAVPYLRQLFTRLDGTLVDVEAAGQPIVFDGRPAVQLTVRDISERVRDEERLTARESRLQTLAAGTHEAIWEWDLDSGEVWTNAAHQELFGSGSTAETLLSDWTSRLHPEDVKHASQIGSAAVLGHVDSWRHEYRFKDPDGEYRVLLDRGRNVVGNDGKRRMIGALLDITPLRQAERERAAADSRYRSIVEQSLVGVYTRTGRRVTYINRKGAEILGYSVDEVLALDDATALMRPGDRESFERSGDIPPLVHATRKDGRALYLSVFEADLSDETETDVRLGTIVDVTAQHEAEQHLIDSERRYRELVESVGEILYTVDLEGRFQSLSRSFEKISGYSVDEWLGKTFLGLFEPGSLPMVVDHFERALAGDGAIIRQYEIRAKHGAVLTVEVTSQPRILDGVVVGTVGVARDVTEIRNAERKLDEARRLASLGQVAASLAHEFNNVLMGIQPFVEVIDRLAPPDPRISDSLSHIKRAIARGKRASQEILRFANPKDARVQDVDVATWLPTIVNHLRPTVPGNIEMRAHAVAGIGTMRVDREQLEQVITNLVFNARDAMSEGGSITLSVDSRQMAVAGGAEPSRFVRIVVADDGPGIPGELETRIFEPLFTTKRGGTGLGLSIARRLIEAVGGSIRLVPAARGTTFELLLPAGEEVQVPPPIVARPASAVRRVLLVEDDEMVGEGLSATLSAEGFETTWVRDIASAAEESRRSRPDVAIIDINLPDGNGLHLMPILRESWHALPVVLSTGHVEHRLEDGDSRTVALLKPYQISELLDAITTVCA